MVDFDILNYCGTTNERLKEIFMSSPPEALAEQNDAWKKQKADWETRQLFEKRIESRLIEHIQFSLRNHPIYSAVDLLWDSVPINKETYPLMLLAQGKIDFGVCGSMLENLSCAQKFVKKDANGKIVGVDLPRFYEVTVNLPRAFITRRLAAQSNRYVNLWPYFKYEPRDVSQVGKLRADVMSMITDIIADQYDYRGHGIQVLRDTFLYAHSVDFPRCSWDREYMWTKKTETLEFEPPDADGKKKPKMQSVIAKEGLPLVNPHPSRTFWDNNYPLTSINTDTGCEYIGFWDIMRYRDVKYNAKFFNRDNIYYSSNVIGIFTTYAQYFTNYYCTINPPALRPVGDPAALNDRKNNIGIYAADWDDTSIIVSNYYEKIIPADHGIGTYPHPIWVRFVTAGEKTVLFAEIMPSRPACVCSYNENDKRQINISVAHELMSYQDQLTNLFSHMLLSIKSDHIKVLLINTDVMNQESITMAREQARGGRYDGNPIVLEYSAEKLADMGLDPSKAVQIVETRADAGIQMIFNAILQLLNMVERLMAMSPQEQGQPAPREISATETNLIAGTTESVFGFISDAYDAYRAALKSLLYESYMACGNHSFRVPAMNRYTRQTIEKAGFKVDEEMVEGENVQPYEPSNFTVLGTKAALVHDYIFTSRDGQERSSNTQSANVLTQLFGLISSNPAIFNSLPREKVFGIINSIFRLSGDDFQIEVQDGDPATFGMDQEQLAKIEQVLQGLTQNTEQNTQAIQQIMQKLSQPDVAQAA